MTFSSETRRAIEETAVDINVEAAALMAVADIESGGTTDWVVGRQSLPPIRFEGHYFYRILKVKDKAKLAAAVHKGLASPVAGVIKNPGSYVGRYNLLANARAIDAQAANESTSWGIGQVMGDNWRALGYTSVDELVVEAMSGVAGQVRLMARFIKTHGLVKHMQDHNWHTFAVVYNGTGNAPAYASKLAAAYALYTKQLLTDKPVQATVTSIGNTPVAKAVSQVVAPEEKPMFKSIFNSIALGIVRHAISFGAGGFAIDGVITGDQSKVLIGAGSILVSVVGSLWNKFNAAKKAAA